MRRGPFVRITNYCLLQSQTLLSPLRRLSKAAGRVGFWQDESGATAIEYGLIVGGIAVAILAIIFEVGGQIEGVFQGLLQQIQSK